MLLSNIIDLPSPLPNSSLQPRSDSVPFELLGMLLNREDYRLNKSKLCEVNYKVHSISLVGQPLAAVNLGSPN